MKDCIFCKIVKGEAPCYKLYEDNDFLAFLDITPLNPGHAMIIPKIHVRYVSDVKNFGDLFEVANKVGKGIRKGLGYKHLYFLTLGNKIDHAHVWVMPHFKGDGHKQGVDWNLVKKINPKRMDEIAKKIRTNI